jgi:hypothetical protein
MDLVFDVVGSLFLDAVVDRTTPEAQRRMRTVVLSLMAAAAAGIVTAFVWMAADPTRSSLLLASLVGAGTAIGLATAAVLTRLPVLAVTASLACFFALTVLTSTL